MPTYNILVIRITILETHPGYGMDGSCSLLLSLEVVLFQLQNSSSTLTTLNDFRITHLPQLHTRHGKSWKVQLRVRHRS